MTISEFAEHYIRKNNHRGRTPIHSANRFERLVDRIEPESFTTELIELYRSRCSECQLSPKTTENSITDLITLIKASDHPAPETVTPGKRLRVPRPLPEPASLDHLSVVYAAAPHWLKQWILIAYWTGLRLADTISLQLSLPEQSTSRIEWTASKTGHRHAFPVPDWLSPYLTRMSTPYLKSNDNSQAIIRKAVKQLSPEPARTLPKHIRQRSITEWSRADGMAGRILHGNNLAVLEHYVDKFEVLESASIRLRLPASFPAPGQADISHLFNRLDSQAREIIRQTAERLAAG